MISEISGDVHAFDFLNLTLSFLFANHFKYPSKQPMLRAN